MEGLNSVIWAHLLSPESLIPHDVAFKILNKDFSHENKLVDYIEKNENGDDQPEASVLREDASNCEDIDDSQILLPAHKLLLASVSPVFRRQFYGSFPAEKVVVIKDSSEKSFTIMLEYIYQQNGGDVMEDLFDVRQLLDCFYLAEKYEVLGLKSKILNRLSVIPVDTNNYGALVHSLLNYSYFAEACEVLENRVCHLIMNHNNPIELVKGAIDSKNDDIKQKVLTKVASVGSESILETVKAAYDIITSEDCKLDIKENIDPVMKKCVAGYEAIHRKPLEFSKFIPEPDSHLQEAFSLLLQYYKNNFCMNCDTAACQKGEKVNTEVMVDTRVLVDGAEKGSISEVGLVMVQKNFINDIYSSDCRKRFDFCAVCTMMGKHIFDQNGSNGCSGLHSKIVNGTNQCKILLDSGEVISRNYEAIVFDCE
eukprot:GFUD01000649.1.p1 GENE.GFUD01000649.1~~GFUD01000649.1.p1  ORF type:complete len:425 (-),score=86.74 GFUD01000649.1:80-1354(-)